MFLSNQNEEKNHSSTVFMGPLSHREERLDVVLAAQLHAKWSEETEAKYMESVRTRATSKVRAMLLQAKKRSDEIITEAEANALEIRGNAEKAYAELLEDQKKAQEEYDRAFEISTKNANETMQEQLVQDQKALGESTAVVLLSIHQQLQNLYDAWREDLRLLTLEAIQVGTGWIADSKREQILSSMLDECVRKMIEKKDYIIRVHPSDGALVTQVLENSREKSWSMEVNPDLEPGSLELESTHAMVKNSSKERKEFVQDILNNLVLPATNTEGAELQSVTDTLMHEMQNNPLLTEASKTDSDDSQVENILPEGATLKGATPEGATLADTTPENTAPEDAASENEMQGEEITNTAMNEAILDDTILDNSVLDNSAINDSVLGDTALGDAALDDVALGDTALDDVAPDNTALSDAQDITTVDDNSMNEAPEANQPSSPLENTNDLEGASNTESAERINENTTQEEINTELGDSNDENKLQDLEEANEINPSTEAENLVDEFLSDTDNNAELQANTPHSTNDLDNQEDAHLSPDTQKADSTSLPPDVADDLLAEMGFEPTDSAPK